MNHGSRITNNRDLGAHGSRNQVLRGSNRKQSFISTWIGLGFFAYSDWSDPMIGTKQVGTHRSDQSRTTVARNQSLLSKRKLQLT